MSIASLEAFLERALAEPELRRQLAEAPDAAAVAAIARSAGFPLSERDLLQATAASPDDLSPAPAPSATRAALDAPEAPASAASVPAVPAASRLESVPLPDPWFPEEPLTRFVHHAQGDAALREALATAPDADAVATIARAAGYPISAVDLWLASGTTPDELAASLRPDGEDDTATETPLDAECRPDAASPVSASAAPGASVASAASAASAEPFEPFEPSEPFEQSLQTSAEEAVRRFVEHAAEDADLRETLASALDAAAVAAIAREAGHPIEELALWLATGAAFEEARPEPEPAARDVDPLALFLRAAEVDPDLRLVLASAPDAATVAAIARLAGFPLTAADLWAASDAAPEELALERGLVEELVVEQLLILER